MKSCYDFQCSYNFYEGHVIPEPIYYIFHYDMIQQLKTELWTVDWSSGYLESWITIRRLCWVQGFKNHCTVGHFLGHPLCFNFKISKIICKTFNSPFSKSIALCFTNLHLCDLFNICPQSAMFARNLFSQFSQRLNFRRWKGFWNFGAPPPPFYRQNPQRSIWHDIWEQKQIKQFFLWIFWKVTRCKRRCPSQEP